MRLCFPRGFIPSESSRILVAENPNFSQMYRTAFVRIQFDVINDVKVYVLEALLRYEARFPDGILATVKEGTHIRIVILRGTDGKYFLDHLVGDLFEFCNTAAVRRCLPQRVACSIYTTAIKKRLEREILQSNLTWLILLVYSYGGGAFQICCRICQV